MKTQKSKKKITAILSIALVAVLAIGGTFAYLSAITKQYDNAFSFDENIKAVLNEPNWDPDGNPDTPPPPSGEIENLTPGAVVRKDPQVTNTSGNSLSEYVAIRVVFTKGSGAKLTDAETARLLDLIDVDFNSADWQVFGTTSLTAAEQIWLYKVPISTGVITNPLFSTVTIRQDLRIPAHGTGTDWEDEYGWMANMVLNHTDDCYTYNESAHAAPCVITYKHHANCALFTGTGTPTQISATAKGGSVGGKTCDCIPANQHQPGCPALVPVLKNPTCHTVSSTISGFHIVVQAAVVQADAFTGLTGAGGADAALKELLDANPYT
jgi:predicted ribosomally synthesized peptide with SipW-like signal peptide